jgi:hypothetical protein
LHAHSNATAPRSVVNFRKRRRNAFMAGIASGRLQQQGARRQKTPGNPGLAALPASTLLAVSAT